MSIVGFFVGIIVKGWILMKGGVDFFVLVLNFVVFLFLSLLVSGLVGVCIDWVGCEWVLVYV